MFIAVFPLRSSFGKNMLSAHVTLIRPSTSLCGRFTRTGFWTPHSFATGRKPLTLSCPPNEASLLASEQPIVFHSCCWISVPMP